VRLFEFEGKQLFRKYGIPTADGYLLRSPEEAYDAVKAIAGPVILKSQVLAKGRSKLGGIRFADGPNEARTVASELFELKIDTTPTKYLLVEQRLEIKQEFYIGITIDRASYKLVLVASGSGGVDVEESAETSPEGVVTKSFSVSEPLYGFDALAIAKKIGIPQALLKQGADVIVRLGELFRGCDAILAEINPLVLTTNNEIIAADSRIVLDENALFRHLYLSEIGIKRRPEEDVHSSGKGGQYECLIPQFDLSADEVVSREGTT